MDLLRTRLSARPDLKRAAANMIFVLASRLGAICVGALIGFAASAANAQEPLKIGVLVTLSGPSAVLGENARNGVVLALKDLGNKMGGRDVELVVVDDEQKPDVAVTKAKELIERAQVDFIIGPIASNVLNAIHKPVTESKTFLLSPNAGSSLFAGKQCNPYFFAVSYENTQPHETVGKITSNLGYDQVVVMAPNYQAGKDAVAGFKRAYTGSVIEELYVPLGTLDFQAELTRIASLKPKAVFAFMPGGMGVNFVKQYKQAGLSGTVPLLSSFTVDESTLPAQQDAALEVRGGMDWAPTLDTIQNKKFVAEYEAAYGSIPASYAAHAYDALNLIDSAVRAVNGDVSDKDAIRAALKKADFQSVRGHFKFNINGYPIQDFYMTKVVKREDGRFQTAIVEKVFEDHQDIFAKDCVAQ